MTALEPGVVLGGDFRLIRPLRSGGMGSVYVVEQLSTGALRALKVMSPELASDARARERFVREARVVAQIDSDHVVEVISAGVDDALSVPFLVMELLRGAELAAVVARLGPLPLGDVGEVMAQVGHALGRAHEAGIVHRDLKPENIFVSVSRRRETSFTVKVLDFGIAKLVADGATQAIGTPLYMPPEQTSRGGRITPASDVWSFGLIAFQLLIGREFWRSSAEALPQLLREVVVDPIPRASERAAELGRAPALPRGFDEWFARSVARDVERRFPDAGAAARAFAELVPPGAPAGAIARSLVPGGAFSTSSQSAATVSAESAAAPASAPASAPGAIRLPSVRGAAPPIVGRDPELRIFADALSALRAGQGAVCFLVGEPGIGKSRLASEVADRAAALQFRIVWGRCWEGAGAPAFWPWIQVLRTLAKDGEKLGALSRLLPESGASSEAAPADRFEVFDALGQLLNAVAARRPLVVVLEDLHDADLTSLSALEFVVRHTREAPLLVVGTYRNVAARVSADAVTLLERAARFATILPLQRLSPAEVAALGGMDAETARAVHLATEGNPLFVHEILRLRSALGPGRRLPVPNGIRAAIREHVRVAGGADEPLEVGAVLGREFTLRSIAAVLERDPIVLAESLEPAVRAGLLTEPLPRQYRFSHVLIRDTLYDDVAQGRRAELHRLAAERLAKLHAGDPAAPLDEIAHHYFEAGPSAVDEAIGACRRAADRAIRMLAFEEAAASLERAQGALEAAVPGDAARRAELGIELGRARILSGDSEAGMNACREAAALARSIGSAELLARAALMFGQIYTPGVPGGELTALLEEAITALGDQESSLRARAMARLSGALQPAPTPDRPIALAREAIAMARRIGDEDALLYALQAGGSALFNVVDPAECIPLHEELLRLSTARGDVATALHARARMFTDHLNLGDVASADAALAAYEAAAVKLSQPRYHWPAALMHAARAQMQGRFVEHENHLREARRLAEAASDRFAQLAAAASDMQAQRLRGRLDVAVPAALMPAFVPIPGAAALFELPRVPENEAALRSAWLAAPEASLERWSGTWSAFGIGVAEVALLVGDADVMSKAYAWLTPVSGRNGAWGGAGMCCEGPVARWLCRLAARLERWDDAERHYADALGRATRMGMSPFVAQLQCEWALELARHGRRRDAATLFDEGRARAEALQMSDWLARLPPELAAPSDEIRMTRDGDVWLVEGEGQQCRVKDSRGLQIIALLVAQPDHELSCLELGGGKEGIDVGDAGPALDPRARDEYRARVRELRAEIDDAESCNDPGRAERARQESEQLERELARALGLGGRDRKAASARERARTNVQRRVKLAIAHVQEHAPALARRLTETLRTGVFCVYEPGRPRRG